MNELLSSRMVCCPVCQSADTQPVIEIEQVPVHCHRLLTTKEAATHVARGDVQLVFCRQCSHLFNASFEPDKTTYTQDYENSLHFSPRFQTYATELVERLAQRYDLHRKNIVEIGSGKGDFLAMLCEIGDNRGVGFDPSSPLQASADGRVHLVSDSYSKKYAHYPADMVVSRHVLEHVPDPVRFLREVREVIEGHRQTVAFFEVPNVMFTLGEQGIWDLIYEHCSYFTSFSLAEAFRRAGFSVLDVREAFSGQFLTIEAAPTGSMLQSEEKSVSPLSLDGGLADIRLVVAVFAEKYRQKIRAWRRHLTRFSATGQRVVVWGAGSKGVTFLNVLDTRGLIEYVIDINPRKEGMYVAGVGQKIIPPEFLVTYRPNTIIVMNANYLEEIRGRLRSLGLEASVMLA